jgi:hypothetical protein
MATITRNLLIGQPDMFESPSPLGSFSVVFEDDGNCGYLYGLDRQRKHPIVDALLLYNAEQFAGAVAPSQIAISWSDDGMKAVLSLDGIPTAVFDFAAKRACCRANFPPPNVAWTAHDHSWDETLLHVIQ